MTLTEPIKPTYGQRRSDGLSSRDAAKLVVAAMILAVAVLQSSTHVNVPLIGVALALVVVDLRNPFATRNVVLLYILLLFGYGSSQYSIDPHRTEGLLLPILLAYIVGYFAASALGVERLSNSTSRNPRRPRLDGFEAGRWVFALTVVSALLAGYSILHTGLGNYYRGQAQASAVSSYGSSGGQLGGIEGATVVVAQVLTAMVIVLAAQRIAAYRPIPYRQIALPLVLLPMSTLQRSQAVLGMITLLGIYAFDKRLAGLTQRRPRPTRPRLRKRQLVALAALGAIAVGVAVLGGQLRATALAKQAGTSPPSGVAAFFKEELTPIQAVSEIQATLPALHSQHGRTVIAPLLTRYIPRSVFPSKPVNSDTYYMRQLHPAAYAAGYSLPVTVFGDGYLNFGFLGLILSAVFLGILTRWVDQPYLRGDRSRSVVYLLGMANLYPVLRDCVANTGAQVALGISIVALSRVAQRKHRRTKSDTMSRNEEGLSTSPHRGLDGHVQLAPGRVLPCLGLDRP